MASERQGQVASLFKESAGGGDHGCEMGERFIAQCGRGRGGGDEPESRGGGLRIDAGEVDAITFEEVAAEILAVVDELQGGADGIGLGEERGGGGCREIEPGKLQHYAAHGVSGACAVVKELVERVVAGDGLVLLEGIEEGVEEGGIEAMSVDGARQ